MFRLQQITRFSQQRMTKSPLLSRISAGGVGCRMSTKLETAAEAPPFLPPTLPPNLIIADIGIFEPPKAQVIANIQFNFPILNPPVSIAALSFQTPGSIAKEVPMNPKIFGVAIRKDIVHEVVRYHRNKLRMPYKTKRPAELRGSGKKPHAQKGIGRSQAGNRRNSSWIGGFKVIII